MPRLLPRLDSLHDLLQRAATPREREKITSRLKAAEWEDEHRLLDGLTVDGQDPYAEARAEARARQIARRAAEGTSG